MVSHYISQILIVNTGMCYLAGTKDQGKRTLTLLNDHKSTPLIDKSSLSLFRFLLFILFWGVGVCVCKSSSKTIFEDVAYFRVKCARIQSPSLSQRKVSMGISSCSLVAIKKATQNCIEAETSAQTSPRTGRTSVGALKMFQS